MQEHREEHGELEGVKRRRGCSRRRGVGQPTSFIGRSEEEPKKEYNSLIGYGAIRPIGSKEYAELQEQYEVVESIPTMLVAVKKPPMKLKARVVACGNHAQEATGCTTAGGVDTVVVRTCHLLLTRTSPSSPQISKQLSSRLQED